jgi:hypothetical protein
MVKSLVNNETLQANRAPSQYEMNVAAAAQANNHSQFADFLVALVVSAKEEPALFFMTSLVAYRSCKWMAGGYQHWN